MGAQTGVGTPETGGDIEAFRKRGKREPSRRGGVRDPDLDPLAAAPAVDAERARHMQRTAERLRQRAAERLARGPERHAPDRRPVAAAQLEAHMAAAPDRPGLHDAMMAKGEHGLGLAGPERSRPLDRG